MSSSLTPIATTTTTLQNAISNMSSSPDANSYSNAPEEQTATETPVPESTTAAETTSEPPLATTTDMEATTTATTEDQTDATTQAYTTTEAPITAEATRTTQEAQAYTEAPAPYQDDQPSLDAQTSMASNPTWTLTETSVSPTIVVVTSTSGVSTVFSTSTCIPDSTATTSTVCSSSSAASQEASAAKITVAQIAGIVVGVLGLFSLLIACILFKKRKHSKAHNNRRISPFFYMNDQHPDPEKSLPFDTSTAALCQSYKNQQPTNTANTNSSVSDMSESVCGDNMFYSNSTDYHRSSSIMHQQGINEKLTVITSPGKSHHDASSPLRMDTNTTANVNTPTTLYPHIKRSDSSDFNKQTSSYNPFSNRQQASTKKTSIDIDTDKYTLSAMQLFQSSSNRNTATTTTTTTTSRSMSPVLTSFVGASRQQYRPSLHDSMYLGSQRSSSNSCNNSSGDDSSTIQSLPMAQQPPPRFSRHHRQESSLDPHFYQQQQQQQPPHTMSLWDDHLN